MTDYVEVRLTIDQAVLLGWLGSVMHANTFDMTKISGHNRAIIRRAGEKLLNTVATWEKTHKKNSRSQTSPVQ